MRNMIQLVLMSALVSGVWGCSGPTSEEAAKEARITAADARVDAADANARLSAADAHVKAADARVAAAEADVAADAADSRVARTTSKAAAVNNRIPSGTPLKVFLIDAIGTDTSTSGDQFLASLSESVVVDGVTLLQKGTKVRGRVVASEGAGRVKGRASIRLTLTAIMRGNTAVPITTDTFEGTSDSSEKRDAGIIAGGAGIGAAIGTIAGGKKGAGIGAIAGGGGGTGVVLATKGKEIQYPSETRLNFILINSVDM